VPHTLLLADDSVTIQRVIELTFADEDVQVMAVSDGEQAIAAVDQRTPDIVLADVGMPGRDGYEVAQHIKNTPRLAHIPVVLLTGAFEPIDQARAEAVGCDGVLAKPFEPQLVIGRVKELLARRPSASVPAESAPARVDAAPPPAPASAPPRPGRLASEQYFEELDQAFATLTTPKSSVRERPIEERSTDAIDWFSRPAPAIDAPAPPVQTAPAPPTSTAAPQPPPAEARAASVAFPSLSDAFVALLAAEQTSPASPVAPIWPAAAPPVAASAEVVDEVTRRVVEQMSDKTVREMAAGIVAQVAERLVREEIERIKKITT
jgi:CheY-like chemotaxis protein